MRDLTRKKQIYGELNGILTGHLLEVFSGVTKKDEALEILAEMKAEIMPAVAEIDKAAAQIRKSR